jgi:hypothetical protein
MARAPDQWHDDVAGFQGSCVGLDYFAYALMADDEKVTGRRWKGEAKRSQIAIGAADADLTNAEKYLAVTFEFGFREIHFP